MVELSGSAQTHTGINTAPCSRNTASPDEYLGGGKWLANEVAGVAGKVFLDDTDRSEPNFHTMVRATLELDPPPHSEPFDPLMRTAWSEDVLVLRGPCVLAPPTTRSEKPICLLDCMEYKPIKSESLR